MKDNRAIELKVEECEDYSQDPDADQRSKLKGASLNAFNLIRRSLDETH